jgi:2-oxoglutarate dehydrogenase E1 component
MRKLYRDFGCGEFDAANNFKPNKADWLDGKWAGFEQKTLEFVRGETGVERDIC